MEFRAQAKFQRIAPRKVRLVVDMVRNMDVETARDQLRVLPKRASVIVLKVINSASANAQSKKKEAKNLIVKQSYVDEGATLKRWRPRAFGRAGQIRKRTSHVTIVLAEKKEVGQEGKINNKDKSKK